MEQEGQIDAGSRGREWDMRLREKMLFFALGCVFVMVGQVTLYLLGYGVQAQGTGIVPASGEFDRITCNEMVVGRAMVTDKLTVFSTGREKVLELGVAKNGNGLLCVNNAKGKSVVKISVSNEDGNGSIRLYPATTDGYLAGLHVNLHVNEYGGQLDLYGNDDKARVLIGVNEYGNGVVNTFDKNGYRHAVLTPNQ